MLIKNLVSQFSILNWVFLPALQFGVVVKAVKFMGQNSYQNEVGGIRVLIERSKRYKISVLRFFRGFTKDKFVVCIQIFCY